MRRNRNRNCYSSQDSKWLWCLFGSLHRACLLCGGWRACWIKSTSRWDDCITGEWRPCLNGCFVNLILHGSDTWIHGTGWLGGSLFMEEGEILSIHHLGGVFLCHWESHLRLHNAAQLSYWELKTWENVFSCCCAYLKGWCTQVIYFLLFIDCMKKHPFQIKVCLILWIC